ncbi:MAG TPA: hypothetical protein DER60_09225, partial [Syntrophomonas sp.]|nr:hypothetical protein [Syntrophomonas sp.]
MLNNDQHDDVVKYIQKIEELEKLLEKERRLHLQADQQLEELFDLSSDLFVITDKKGHIKRANANFISVTNYTGGETITEIINNKLHPDDIESTLKAMRRVVRDRKQNLVFRYRNDDGSFSWCSCNIIVSKEEDVVIGVGRNITESKESERRQADIINFLPDATLVI